MPKGKWWEVFNDPVLNGLVEQVSVSNQTLKVAEARYGQARAAVASARSQFFPVLRGDVTASRSGALHDGSGGVGDSYGASLDARGRSTCGAACAGSWRPTAAAEAASAADLEAARLSLQAELATNYFQLRVTDVQSTLLEDTLKAFQPSYRHHAEPLQRGRGRRRWTWCRPRRS